MGRKNFNSFLKKQRAEKKKKKKQEKQKKKAERGQTSGTLEDMMAYVDKEGNIVGEKPEEDDTIEEEEG